MLVLTSYYGEVRQDLGGGKRHGHHVDMHCSSLTQHWEKRQVMSFVCVCELVHTTVTVSIRIP